MRLRRALFQPVRRGKTGSLALAEPLTYMNSSGAVMPSLMRWAGASLDELLVICDNLDLPPGVVRLKRRGSGRGHRGVSSVMDAIGSGDFPRLYIGIGRPPVGIDVPSYVLDPPGSEELAAYRRAFSVAADAIEALTTAEIDDVMNQVNGRG